MLLTGTVPIEMLQLSVSQKRTMSRVMVDLPLPDAPTRAVILPCFMVATLTRIPFKVCQAYFVYKVVCR
jgi:hypothetical protein